MKIKAFTLVEIIIAMLISSIVISIMLSLYLNFSMSSEQSSREQELETDICLLYSALSNDVYKSESINKIDEKILDIEKETGIIRYEFCDEKVIRIFANNRDTLRVRVGNISIIQKETTSILDIEVREKKGYKLKFSSRRKNGRY